MMNIIKQMDQISLAAGALLIQFIHDFLVLNAKVFFPLC